jgi:hydrogenase expression/formation protein HypD
MTGGPRLFLGFRDRELVQAVAKRIAKLSKGGSFRIMHVCGTHEWAITHSGIRDLLPREVKIVAGPGCPVCVTPGNDIDAVAGLSMRERVTVTTFGDLLRVPGNTTSLEEAKSKGGRIKVIYSIEDAIKLAREQRGEQFVHFSIGFETTAPMTAVEVVRGLPDNMSVFTSHRLIPPAMEFLLQAGANIDGFICPGHVSTIIGVKPYKGLAEKYRKPMVISGFEPLDVIMGIMNVVWQKVEKTHDAVNEYKRAVRDSGNMKAQEVMGQAFEVRDSFWRGIGMIPRSGMGLRREFEGSDAVVRFGMGIEKEDKMPEGCSCGAVLKGEVSPKECPLFGKGCTPERPVGPCMVSSEGTCAIVYKFAMPRERK